MRPLVELVSPKLSHKSLEYVVTDPNALVCRRKGAWWPRNKPRAADAVEGREDWHRSPSREEEKKEKPLLLLLLLLLALIERPLLVHAAPLWAREATTEAIGIV